VVENYGASELARRFGVTRYPAIFVDDILVATPKDFGFFGKAEGAKEGRYTPLRSAASHERFRSDLAKMVELIAAGKKDVARAAARPSAAGEIASLPAFEVTDLAGGTVRAADLRDRVVLVEFWATWCPPCRGTLGWLGALKERHGDRLAVLAVAIESEEADVRQVAGEMSGGLRFAMGTPELARAFGDVSAVPTLFVFDRKGGTAAAYFGAPPGLHDEAEAAVAGLLK
jgi:thiol-disulfide isomerase/thioredoxin